MTTTISIDDNYQLDITEGCELQSNPNSEDAYDDENLPNIFLLANHRQFYVNFGKLTYSNVKDYINQKQPTTLYPLKGEYYVYLLYAYIHSGVSLQSTNVGCRFDTGYVGIICINANNNVNEHQELIDNFINEWNEYLSSPGYSFILYKKEYYTKIYKTKARTSEKFYDLDKIDSCSGFIKSEDIIEYISIELSEEIKKQIKNI